MDWQRLVLEQATLIEHLRARIVELEAEVAALKKHSGNSSKPPSSDIVKPPKEPSSQGKDRRKGQKRNRGAQKGHKQNLRKPFDASQIDQTVELKLDACPTCGGKLKATNEPPKVHQQVELIVWSEYRLVEKPFLVTEFRQTWFWASARKWHTPTRRLRRSRRDRPTSANP